MMLPILIRTVAVYVFIVVAIRLFGKREIAQLSITDLVFILLISNAVQNAMVGDNTSLLGGLIAAASLFVINFIFGTLFYKSARFSAFFQGHALMLIYEGKEITANLNKAKISHDELDAVVREHGVKNIADVDLAILELDGNISVLSENFRKRTKRRRAHKVLTKTE